MSFQSRTPPIPQNLYVSEVLSHPSLRQRIGLTLALWRQRTEMRRRLAEMDSRSLRDVGISPMLLKKASYFWSRCDSVALAGLVMETRDDG